MGDFEKRTVRAPQGRKKLTREREEYFRLVDQGVSSRRRVGSWGSIGAPARHGGMDGTRTRSRRGHLPLGGRCHPPGRDGTCMKTNGSTSLTDGARRLECARLPASCAVIPPRSVVSCGVIVTPITATTDHTRHSAARSGVDRVPRSAKLRPLPSCRRPFTRSCTASGARNRSHGGWIEPFPPSRRCGCAGKRSIRPCTAVTEVIYTAISHAACARHVPCANPAVGRTGGTNVSPPRW